MKLSSLVYDIVVSDADYFAKNGFIMPDERDRVVKWLNGHQDDEIQLKVADWLESDGQYFDDLASALCRFHWFIWPFMLVLVKVVPKRLKKYAKELRDGCS